jgi:hypothetical protein
MADRKDNTTHEEMFEHQIIQEYLLQLQVVAEAENVINICGKATWADDDLSKLEELVWNDIGPIPCSKHPVGLERTTEG